MDQTQVMVGNFPSHVKGQELAAYLQKSLGIVDRCRVKRVYGNTPPHAFVKFMSAAVAREACSESDRGRLNFQGCELKIAPCSVQAKSKLSHEGLIELRKVQFQLGTLTGLHELLLSWRIPEDGCSLRVNGKQRKMFLFFTHEVVMSTNVQDKEICEFKLEISLRDVRKVTEVQTQRGRMPELMMILQLWSPPLISYRTAQGDDVYCTTHSPLPDDDDPWIRKTDFTPRRSIGRCLAYVVRVSPREATPFRQLLEYFRVQRLFDRSPPRRLNFPWEGISDIVVQKSLFFVPDQYSVPFSLMYLVNALVNRGIVNTTSLTEEFYTTILKDQTLSRYAMQHLLTYTHPVFNAVHRIQQVKEWARKYEKDKEEVKILPSGNMTVYRVIITPTRAYCAMPVREMSNRVLRHFHMLSDRFLRVSFMDDDLHPLSASALTVPVAPIVRSLSSAHEHNRTELYRRVLDIVKKGFHLCGRQYEFLAFSSSQVRDASAWFFAGNNRWNATLVRRWMGQFPTHNVAKFAARMGQCFSSTFLTLPVPKTRVRMLPDVERNGYVFSDGCGRIAPEFAFQVSETLNLDHTPSLYQIRYAGCKGVIAAWPIESSLDQYDLGYRMSMNKFSSDHTELEVIGWSKYLPCYLNRQIICLLSTLQVKNAPFRRLQDVQVARLEAMLNDPGLAYEVLTSSCTGDVHSTAATMLLGGFHPRKEPHLYDMLLSIRTSQLEDLVAKARIYVPNGRWLMGCMDETALLEYGQCFIRVSGPVGKGSLGGDGFNQGHRSGSLQVITGKVIMAKNPCLHPGDIRILEAVDVPQLYSMIDCLVVPQNGDRPHPNEASGSDLDGDVYFTCWDQNLIPPSGKSWEPMVYNAHEQRILNRRAKIEDVMEFFVKAMINDSLGVISNSHLVHADRSPIGALDEKCLLLARLAATAVDFPKTGKVAIMPHPLRIKEFPDFMEKDEAVTYHSDKIIGELYRSVTKFVSKEVEHHRHADHAAELDPVYDDDLQVPGYEQYLEDAWATKVSYDQQLRGLMSHFSVKREADIITGRMQLQARISSRQKSDMIERMIHAHAGLRREFQADFYKSAAAAATAAAATASASCSDDSSMVAADSELDIQAKLASAMYHVTYDFEWKEKAVALLDDSEDARARPLISFPWIAAPVLAQIKYVKRQQVNQVTSFNQAD